jgi:Protein of unknown function (DUF3363)
MAARDDEIRIRPGFILPGHRAGRPRTFVGEVMRAAKKAGHIGKGFGRTGTGKPRSTWGRGSRAALALSSRSPARHVVIMARVVRHRGRQFVAAPLAKHVSYFKREGVTRDGEDSCVGERMTGGISSSAETTLGKGFGSGRLSGSRSSSAREPRARFTKASGRRSRPNAGLASTRRFATSLMGSAGFVDLRAGAAEEDQKLRGLVIGRAGKLERLGLIESIGPAHGVGSFALYGDQPALHIIGRLVERGLQDELKGIAYAIVERVDGRTHHLRFADLELTSDAEVGAVVEARSYSDANGRKRLSLAVQSGCRHRGAALCLWRDLARPPAYRVRSAADRKRVWSRGAAGHEPTRRPSDRPGPCRQARARVVFARGLLNTLRQRELDRAVTTLSADTGLTHRPSTEGGMSSRPHLSTLQECRGPMAEMREVTVRCEECLESLRLADDVKRHWPSEID